MKDTVTLETWARQILARVDQDPVRALAIGRNELPDALRDAWLRQVFERYRQRPAAAPAYPAAPYAAAATPFEVGKSKLIECRGDSQEAKERVIEVIELLPNWEEEAKAALADKVVNQAANAQREKQMRAARAEKDEKGARKALKLARDPIDYLIDGRSIWVFTPDELRTVINKDRATAATFNRRADFLEQVLKRMKNGKTVRDCLAEGDMLGLMQRFNVLDKAA